MQYASPPKSEFINDHAMRLLGIHEFVRSTINIPSRDQHWLDDQPLFETRIRGELEQGINRYIETKQASDPKFNTWWAEGARIKYRLPEGVPQMLANRLLNMDEKLRPTYREWLDHGQSITPVSIAGHDIVSIQRKLPFATISAIFSWLDAFTIDPVRTLFELEGASKDQLALDKSPRERPLINREIND